MQHFDRKIKLGIGRPGSEIINYQVDNINKQSQPNFLVCKFKKCYPYTLQYN